MAPAERAKAYRARRKATGCKEVKCYLEPEHIAYLSAVCTAHQVHIAEAVALALTALIRSEAPRTARTETLTGAYTSLSLRCAAGALPMAWGPSKLGLDDLAARSLRCLTRYV